MAKDRKGPARSRRRIPWIDRPKTAKGKAKAKMNALKHGLTTKEIDPLDRRRCRNPETMRR
jgi:hypothetical protein